MIRRLSVVFTLVTLASCARSEPVESFKPDRAEEKVKVTETKPVAPPVEKADKAAMTLEPKDQCSSDATFAAYRKQLDEAVEARSMEKLRPLVDPAIKLDFGGGAGLDTLATRLAKTAEGPHATRPLWDELAEVLTLGCALDPTGKLATMPYAFAQLGDRDGATTMYPRRETISLYKEAKADAPKLRDLHWDALTMTAPTNAKDEFVAVKLDDGTAGFVRRSDARSALDYRALFNEGADGNWKMTGFFAGD